MLHGNMQAIFFFTKHVKIRERTWKHFAGYNAASIVSIKGENISTSAPSRSLQALSTKQGEHKEYKTLFPVFEMGTLIKYTQKFIIDHGN